MQYLEYTYAKKFCLFKSQTTEGLAYLFVKLGDLC